MIQQRTARIAFRATPRTAKRIAQLAHERSMTVSAFLLASINIAIAAGADSPKFHSAHYEAKHKLNTPLR